MPMLEIPADISKGEHNHESAYHFVALLETKAQDNPALRPLLSAWINLIPVDDKYQKAVLGDILKSIRYIQEMKSAFLNSLLFSLRNGINLSKEVQDSLNSIRTDLSRFLSDRRYKEQFEELVQNILAMPLCPERKTIINHLLVAMNQNRI
jgi:hypothetical protein